jgi:hypothetical protein
MRRPFAALRPHLAFSLTSLLAIAATGDLVAYAVEAEP